MFLYSYKNSILLGKIIAFICVLFLLTTCKEDISKKRDVIKIKNKKGEIISEYTIVNRKLEGWSYEVVEHGIKRYKYHISDILYTDVIHNEQTDSLYYSILKAYIVDSRDTISVSNCDSIKVKFFTRGNSIDEFNVYIYKSKPVDIIKERPCFLEIYKDANFIYFNNNYGYYNIENYYYIEVMYVKNKDDRMYSNLESSATSKVIHIITENCNNDNSNKDNRITYLQNRICK